MVWPARRLSSKHKPGNEAPHGAMPALRLEGKRIILRPPAAEDTAAWITVRGENRAHLEPYEPLWPSHCLSKSFYARRLRRQAMEWQTGRGCAFLIFCRETGNLIGGANINNITRGAAQFASLGYWISKPCEGRGYMHEALSLILAYSFKTLKLHRISASCLPHNVRSVNLLRRLGFIEEGYAKNYIQIAGQWQDHRLFGLSVEAYEHGQAVQDGLRLLKTRRQ
jgi:ribosomal-protein-alanine N-acetyltransferase